MQWSRTRHHSCLSWLAAACALCISTPALAHEVGESAGGFFSGLSHPVSGLDHVAAMIAVGLWGAQLGNPALWILPVMFPLVMATGGFLGLVGIPLPAVEVGIALSAIVLGLMVVLQARPPLVTSIAIVSVFAVFHGHAHGTELPEGQNGLVYSIGFVLATGLLHLVGILIGTIHYWERGKIALRTLGGLVLVGGLYFFWRAIE
ncbi:MAG: HupE/UreJ family protein [Phycisphaerales bacterium]|nr:MAG: HupE/UreJ family protein [Phycisphaerales bacterium]